MELNYLMTALEELNLHNTFSKLEIDNTLTSSCLLKLDNISVATKLDIQKIIERIKDFKFSTIKSFSKKEYKDFKDKENKVFGDLGDTDWIPNLKPNPFNISFHRNLPINNKIIYLGVFINLIENYICIQGQVFE